MIGDAEKSHGRIKAVPEDFIVDELPLYEPCGQGGHLFVRIRKRNLTTDEAVQRIAKKALVRSRDIGVAGLKDKIAITTQTLSVPIPPGTSSDALRGRIEGVEGIEILSAIAHSNKLKTGHLAGNRFTVRVTDVSREAIPSVAAAIDRIRREGVPNAFGSQRFGRNADNATAARTWLMGGSEGPRDPRQQRFLWSALQSAMFNDTLERRIASGTWATALRGDLLRKRASGGIFLCEDPSADIPRTLSGEVSPTGPMFGFRMRDPEETPLEVEQKVFVHWLEGRDRSWLQGIAQLGEGARRPLRLWVDAIEYEETEPPGEDSNPSFPSRTGITLRFVLPKGSYATVVLSNIFRSSESDGAREVSLEG